MRASAVGWSVAGIQCSAAFEKAASKSCWKGSSVAGMRRASRLALAGGVDHGGGGVDTGEDSAGGGDGLGEGTVAAADIEDVLAGLRGEESDDTGGEIGDEAAVDGVGCGVPGLAFDGMGGSGCEGLSIFHILNLRASRRVAGDCFSVRREADGNCG